MSLKLRQIETNTEHIKNLRCSYYHIIGAGNLNVTIYEKDITCSNKDEILDALYRKGKRHFKKVDKNVNEVTFQVDVSARLFGGRGPEEIEEARKNLVEGVQNTIDDVFGVGCAEVE